jgi:tetratricopeptide (TPR) repeat protein
VTTKRKVFWGVFLPLTLLYAATRAPTVTGEDSGELVTAAWTLGVGHPPGYPLWILLTRLFMGIVCPTLSPADGAALFSGITTALSLGVFATVSFRLTGAPLASWITALLLGLVPEIWNHATIAEVYPLNLLLVMWSLALLLDWQERPDTRRLFAFALVCGFGVSNHPYFLLLLPLYAVSMVVSRRELLRDWRGIGAGVLGIVLPHLVYLQVLIAAASKPVVDWGVKPTLASVVAHYTREVYSHGPAKTVMGAGKLAAVFEAVARHHVSNVTLMGWALLAAGLVLLAVKSKMNGRLLLGQYLVGTLGLILAVPFDVEREEVFAVRVFLIPAYLLLGFGGSQVLALVERGIPEERVKWAFALGLVLPVGLGVLRYRQQDRTHYYWSEDYGRAILDTCPKNAVLLPGGDTSTFPVIYLQACLKERPDVTVIDKSGTIDRPAALALLPSEMRKRAEDAPREELVNLLVRHSKRPLVSLKPEIRNDEITYVPHGVGYVAVGTGDKDTRRDLGDKQKAWVKGLTLRNETRATVEDYTADLIRSHLAQVRAAHHLTCGDQAKGLAEAETAVRYASGIKETLNNTASLLADHGALERAAALFARAVQIRPDYAIARRNLVVVLRQLGREADALAEVGRGLALDPSDTQLFDEGVEAARSLDDGAALQWVCEVRIDSVPQDPKPYELLGDHALNRDGSTTIALLHYEAALMRDPDNRRLRARVDEIRARDLGLSNPDAFARAGFMRDGTPLDHRSEFDRSDPSPRRRRSENPDFTQIHVVGAGTSLPQIPNSDTLTHLSNMGEVQIPAPSAQPEGLR